MKGRLPTLRCHRFPVITLPVLICSNEAVEPDSRCTPAALLPSTVRSKARTAELLRNLIPKTPLLVIVSDVAVRLPVFTITPEAPLLLIVLPYVSTFEALTVRP